MSSQDNLKKQLTSHSPLAQRAQRSLSEPQLSRRAFLRGLGASLALPWLESLQPKGVGALLAQTPSAPRRLMVLYTPNGYNMSSFWPSTPGALTASALTSNAAGAMSLSSLAPWASHTLVARGLDNFAATAQGDGPGDHARGTSAFLTCAHPLKSADLLRSGPSIDQLIAQAIGHLTPLRSLELSCEGGANVGSCDSGYSCAYSRNISWANAQTPVPREVNPRLLFERLFGALDPNQSPEAVADRLRRRRSVLDFVLSDAQAMRARVSASDAQRLDAYLTGVRELERRLQESSEGAQCAPNLERPLGVPATRPEHAELMLDLAAEAIICDQTRVVTMMLGHGGANLAYSHLGIGEGHHALSHHQSDPSKLSQLTTIDTWQVSLFARLIARLSEVQEGEGSALSNTTLLLSSEVADGNSHQHHDLPVVLAGRCGGLTPGRYVSLAEGNNSHPISNLYLQLAADMGAPLGAFGDDGVSPMSF